MHQLASAYRSHGDLDRARDWHQRAHDAAMAISDEALAAGALIGLAEVAIADDDDVPAAEHLKKALGLVDRLPAWEVKASALYFIGQLQARSGDLRAARRTLDKTHTIATHTTSITSQMRSNGSETTSTPGCRSGHFRQLTLPL